MSEDLNQDIGTLTPWEGVDGILVINMDSSPERYEKFIKNVAVHFPSEKFHRISAVAGRELASYGKPPWFTNKTGARAKFWGGTGGCALSHRNAIAFAKSQGWRNVLIFEDDVILEQPTKVGVVVAAALRRLSGEFLFYLGYNKPAPYGQLFATVNGMELWQTEGVIAAHSYIVPECMYDKLLSVMPRNDDDVWEWLSSYRAVDVLYRDFVPMMGAKIYVLNPPVCIQNDVVSDIADAAFDGQSKAYRGHPLESAGGHALFRQITRPLRNLKVRLNSIRTRRRAVKGGLPGYRKRKK